jgi:hypothetical protein
MSQPWLPIPGQQSGRIKPRQHTLIATRCVFVLIELAGVKADIGVAKKSRLITRLAGLHCHIGVPGIKWSAIEDRTVVMHIHAGIKTGARWAARGCLCIVVPERKTLRGKCVQMGCFYMRVT